MVFTFCTNMMKVLLLFTAAIFLIHKMTAEPQRVDFALWNDFKIKSRPRQSSVFEDSKVVYSLTQSRFLIQNNLADRVSVDRSSKVDLFEPLVKSSLTFHSLIKVKNAKNFRIQGLNVDESFRFDCGVERYRVWLKPNGVAEDQLPEKGKMGEFFDGCVLIQFNRRFLLQMSKELKVNRQSILKRNWQSLQLVKRKYKINKFVFAKEIRGYLFLAGIDSHKIVFFDVSRKENVVRRMGSFSIENTFPLGNLLRCQLKENCLNLNVIYNMHEQVYFIFMPPNNLVLFQPKSYVLTSRFIGLSMQKMANMGVHTDKGLLMARVHRTNFEKEPLIEVNLYHYNLKTKKYRTYHEELIFVERYNSFLSISKLITMEKQGIFTRNQSRKVFSDLTVSRGDNEKLLCVVLKSKRILCYKLFWNLTAKKEQEMEPLRLFVSSILKSLATIIVLIIGLKFFMACKSTK